MKDFSYASDIMNKKFSGDAGASSPRDRIFRNVLGLFNQEPLTIFQVGAVETFESKFRWGSGWSDMIFGEYISNYGGMLKIVDINLDHLAHSFLLAEARGYEIRTGLGDALDLIIPGFDIYYLDGADEPTGNQETLDQFKKIEDTECVVIVDDVKTKGQMIMPYVEEKGYKTEYHPVANGMLTIDIRNK